MRSNVCQPLYISCRGMDYRTGRPGPGAHELRGPLSQSLYVKSLCSSYLWLKKLYFVNIRGGLNVSLICGWKWCILLHVLTHGFLIRPCVRVNNNNTLQHET